MTVWARSGARSGRNRAQTDRRRLSGDSGAATSLSIALLTPLFVVLAFAAVQAAMWSHAKTEARVVARDTAGLVARSGVAPTDAQAAAAEILATDTSLREVTVGVSRTGGVVVVSVSASAPGIIMGTASDFEVTAAVPFEEITAP
jgi:Flp pilus assembly protein TadG